MAVMNTIKKHKKALLIGGGIAAALLLFRKTSAPMSTDLMKLRTLKGALGSLE